MSERVRLFVAVALPLLVLALPTSWIPMAGLTTVEHRMIAIFLMATLFWILEPIPIFATSLLIIVVELLLVSDAGLVWLRPAVAGEAAGFGVPLSYKAVMATLASPVIMLFLGGFFLAMAATKYRLDVNLARVLLQPFGSNPRTVLLGLMAITALFSMFMSNTATTAMMLAILAPVLTALPAGDPARTAFVLSVPFAANLGGLGTPIGTPPNAVAMKYLTGEQAMSFGAWMSFAVPFVLVMLICTWLLLLKFFPPQTRQLVVQLKGNFLKNWKAVTVYATFVVTTLLWLTDTLHGMNSYVVALIPVAVFAMTRILTPEDLRQISWDVLWLVAGGIALGEALEASGLTRHLVASIPFATFPPFILLVLAVLGTLLMANFMSHTATANLLLPIMAALGASLPALQRLGGGKLLVLAVTFAASLAMALPISTPPNAMAHASGLVTSRQMSKIGVVIGGLGLLAVLVLVVTLQWLDWP